MSGMDIRGVLLLLSVGYLVSSQVKAADDPSVHQDRQQLPRQAGSSSETETIPLTITDREGRAHVFTVSVARKPKEKEIGLSGRKEVPENTGMLFVFTPPQNPVMWMRNTIVPLDIVFIDAAGRITDMAENTVPFSEARIISQKPSVAVLEVPGGTMERYGLTPGDRVVSAGLDTAQKLK